VSDRSPWLQSIVDKLADSLGTSEQKRSALKAAADMEAELAGESSVFGETLKRMFMTWVEQMRYLIPEEKIDHNLPNTMMRSDAEVALEYGLTSKAATTAKQEQISANREIRINRAVEYLNAGYIQEDCIIFVGAKDEWQQAKQRARRVAA
jgi:hypothetical protein